MANSMVWSAWYDALEMACMDAGYDSRYETPVFDYISTPSKAAEKVDAAIYELYKQGLSPEEVVAELEDRDGFIRKHNIGV